MTEQLSGAPPEMGCSAHFHNQSNGSRLLKKSMELCTVESFRQGPRGAEHDLRVLAGEWGFQLKNIRKSVHIWHGDVDSVVPSIHSEYVHFCLRDAQLCIVSGEAHFSLPVMHRTEVLRTILQAGTW